MIAERNLITSRGQGVFLQLININSSDCDFMRRAVAKAIKAICNNL